LYSILTMDNNSSYRSSDPLLSAYLKRNCDYINDDEVLNVEKDLCNKNSFKYYNDTLGPNVFCIWCSTIW